MVPRVLRQVLELGADEVADGDQVRVGTVALGACLGCLDAPVDGFGKAVVQAGAEVFEDAGQMLLHGGPQALERAPVDSVWPS